MAASPITSRRPSAAASWRELAETLRRDDAGDVMFALSRPRSASLATTTLRPLGEASWR